MTETYSDNTLKIDTTHGHPSFYMFVQKMCEIHAAKNQDYGGGNPLGNFLECNEIDVPSVIGIMVRLGDKWSRLKSLIKQGGVGQVKDESIIDTLMDTANYSILMAVMFKLYGLNLPVRPEIEKATMVRLDTYERACRNCHYHEVEPNEYPCKKCIDKGDNLLPHFEPRQHDQEGPPWK